MASFHRDYEFWPRIEGMADLFLKKVERNVLRCLARLYQRIALYNEARNLVAGREIDPFGKPLYRYRNLHTIHLGNPRRTGAEAY